MELTKTQEQFAESQESRILFTGPRQIGHTEACVVRAIREKSKGKEVALSAPNERMRRNLEEAFLERTTIDGAGGIGRVSGIDLIDARNDEVHHYNSIIIDNCEGFEDNEIRDLSGYSYSEICSIAMVGTPVVNSKVIDKRLEDPKWNILTSEHQHSDIKSDEFLEKLDESMNPKQFVVEGLGMIVKDPNVYSEERR